MFRRFLLGLIPVLVGVAVLGAGGAAAALTLENQDTFCASCHTQPEVTFFARSAQGQATDLASFHAEKQTRCIDCHSGSGVSGRVAGLEQGQRDLFAFLSGSYHRPAITTTPLGDDACLKCHADVLSRVARRGNGAMNGHYHYFLPRWQASSTEAHCVTCHVAHAPAGDRLAFLDPGTVTRACNTCHTALGRHP